MIITVDIDGVPLCGLGRLGFEVTRIWNGQADLQLPDGWSIAIDGEHTRKIIHNNNDLRATKVTTRRGKEILWLLTRFSVNDDLMSMYPTSLEMWL